MPEMFPAQIEKPANLDEQYILKDRVKRVLKSLKNTGVVSSEIQDDIQSLLKLEKADYSGKLEKTIADYEESGFLALAVVWSAVQALEAALVDYDNQVV